MPSDLTRVTTKWYEATDLLIGHALPVIRVERFEDRVCVIWRSIPTPEQKDKANALIGAATHAW